MIKYIIRTVMEKCPEEMDFFNSFVDKGLKERLEHVASSDFGRVTYTGSGGPAEKSGEKFDYPGGVGHRPADRARALSDGAGSPHHGPCRHCRALRLGFRADGDVSHRCEQHPRRGTASPHCGQRRFLINRIPKSGPSEKRDRFFLPVCTNFSENLKYFRHSTMRGQLTFRGAYDRYGYLQQRNTGNGSP